MAVEYFIQTDGRESGPFRFRDLVEFVRQGKLVHSDQVRFSWTNTWQRADSLIGLLHMAQKSPQDVPQIDAPPANLPEPPEREPISAEPDGEVNIPAIVDRPGWIMRLVDVGRFRKKRPIELPKLGPATMPSDAAVARNSSDCDSPTDASPMQFGSPNLHMATGVAIQVAADTKGLDVSDGSSADADSDAPDSDEHAKAVAAPNLEMRRLVLQHVARQRDHYLGRPRHLIGSVAAPMRNLIRFKTVQLTLLVLLMCALFPLISRFWFTQRSAYYEIATTMETLRNLREIDADDETWKQFRRRSLVRLHNLVPDLEAKADVFDPASLTLLGLARDDLPELLGETNATSEALERRIETRLEKVRSILLDK